MFCLSSVKLMCVFVPQELAGYTGGDASFLKEDFELQLNRRLFWDSVRQNQTWST